MLQDPRSASDVLSPPAFRPPSQRQWNWRQHSLTIVLSVLLLSSILTGVGTIPAFAASTASAPGVKGGLTFKQFLAQKRPDGVYHGNLHKPNKIVPVPTSSKEHGTDYSKLPPSSEPAKMKPLTHALTGMLQTPAAPVTPTPVVKTTPTPAVTVTPSPVATTTPTPVVTVTPTPKASPTPVVTVTATPKASPTPTPAVTGTASPAVRATSALVVTATPTATTGTLDLKGSDGRLEVQLAPGSLNTAQAKTDQQAAPTGELSLKLSQLSGHIQGESTALGVYQVQVVDSSGHTVSGITAKTPVIFVYHYQPDELTSLGLDPNHLILTWPTQLAQARQNKQAQTPYQIALKNDPVAHTLTAESTILDSGTVTLAGTTTNQQVPTPHFASEQGNSGQLAYSYPLQVPLGPAGFAPQLSLNYSSGSTNERYSRTSPAGSVGEGWSLSLGAITSETYDLGSAAPGPWYFLSGVDNVSDRLVPNPSPADPNNVDFLTEHISQLRVRQSNPTTQNTCFTVYDPSDTVYEFGCTPDSVRYLTTAGVRTNYEWDLDRIIAPTSQTPGTGYKIINVSYRQDCTESPCANVRDAGIKQITYGYSTSGASTIDTLVGTVDFTYAALPYSSTTCSDGSTTNNGGLRCDDPAATSALPAPKVMSTLTLQSVISYVGSDTNGPKAYSYVFSYQDSAASTDTDPITQAQEGIAGEHLLTKISPRIYQNNSEHQMMPVLLQYNARTNGGSDITTDPLKNTYYDSTMGADIAGTQYSQYTAWQYLTKYWDSGTGIGASISYARAYNNTHGTPENHGDSRYNPLYCTLYASECTGDFAHPDDRAWSVQVVTGITALGSDAAGLPTATTSYSYRLAKTGQNTSTCTAPAAGGDTDCVGFNWTPINSGLSQQADTDWTDYYHAEYRGFNAVLHCLTKIFLCRSSIPFCLSRMKTLP